MSAEFEQHMNMVPWERYMRDVLPVRLGNLASNMAHIRTFCAEGKWQMLFARFVRESMWFIEWTAPEADVEVASELVEIQVELARWYREHEVIWNNPARCSAVAEQAGKWADRIVDLSGLLNDETYEKYNIPKR